MDETTDATSEAPDPMADFPRDARPWLDLIKDGERCFSAYNEKADNIDKLYANLAKMATVKADREFQIFWANLEVLKPSIYARAPIPVVVPRFKDSLELPAKASEILERTLCTTFDREDIDSTMKSIRDDLAVNARGVGWLRYESFGEAEEFTERVCLDHIDRKDFLHEPARKWAEVGWVARRVFMTMEQGRKRFKDAFLTATMERRKDHEDQDYEGEKKAAVWEIWSKTKGAVIWVSPGVAEILDVQQPFLKLEGFFPCPRPVYGTVQRASLIPVPDFLYYRDQVEEINELTARISALCESLRMKGFYASGAENMSAAIETALKQQDNAAILIPVPTFALMAGQSIKDAIVWLPVTEIATVVRELIANRKQLIEDVYQITGISDIMRGDSNANETLGAQQLKSQYGSTRIRDRQSEMVRIARDMTRIAAEIIAENFQSATLAAMSQIRLPTLEQVQQQLAAAQAGGQPMPDASKMPVTMEAVVELYRAERARPFVLDIETDSTVQPDEDADKQRRTELVGALGAFFQQALPLVQAAPEAAEMVTEILKFTVQGFRAGRQLEGVIESFAQKIKEKAAQPAPQQPNPEMLKLELEKQKAQAEAEGRDKDAQLKAMEIQMVDAREREKMDRADALERERIVTDRDVAVHKINADHAAKQLDHEFRREAAGEEMAFKREEHATSSEMERERMSSEGAEEGAAPTRSAKKPAAGPIGEAISRLGELMLAQADRADQRHAETMQAMDKTLSVVAAPKVLVRDASGKVMGAAPDMRMN